MNSSSILLVLALLISVIVCIVIWLQPSKQNDVTLALSRSGEDMFSKSKMTLYEKILKISTIILVLILLGTLIAINKYGVHWTR
ncbi:preprotein translocase subunit SecG [Latilactobacillus sakei]|uniref:preprotein translocase subunit SecG n=1 Tax=Latilactobacillus sakei TaxID=1599 RepID=UPI003D7C2B4F